VSNCDIHHKQQGDIFMFAPASEANFRDGGNEDRRGTWANNLGTMPWVCDEQGLA
jgi:hypothetical protein